jgi:group I intron endonuclease
MQIYKITNLINDKIYIGKNSTNNSAYYGSGVVIKHAIKKYGKENFKKEILEECDSFDLLNEKEKYWIHFYDSTNITIGYNRSFGGDGFSGITPETINKIVSKNTGKKRTQETRNKMSDKSKNIPKTKEHKKSLSKAWEKRKIEHPHTKETLKKMSDSMLGKNAKNTYKLIDPNKKEYIVKNLTQFAKDNNLQSTLLSIVASGKRLHHKGWVCKKL